MYVAGGGMAVSRSVSCRLYCSRTVSCVWETTQPFEVSDHFSFRLFLWWRFPPGVFPRVYLFQHIQPIAA